MIRGKNQPIYLHGRSDHGRAWDRAFETLAEAGYPVFPDTPESVESDAQKRRISREQRVAAMATCDALLMVAPEDPAVFSEELMVLGKADRGLAIDRAERELGLVGKRLPGAVIDTVRDPDRARRRSLRRATRAGWFAFESCLGRGNHALAGRVAMTASTEEELLLPPAPYPGLRAFTKAKWPIFFGREVDDPRYRVSFGRVAHGGGFTATPGAASHR